MVSRNNKRLSRKQKAALVNKANSIFKDVDTLNDHFEKLKLKKVKTMEEGIEQIKSLWLNICDFVSGELKPFRNYYSLKQYTLHKRKFFPKEQAKDEHLGHMLIKILH